MPATTQRRAIIGAITGMAVAALSWAKDPPQHIHGQPHMTAARKALETARNQLQESTLDHGGHRLKALDLVNRALAEVSEGIHWSNVHG